MHAKRFLLAGVLASAMLPASAQAALPPAVTTGPAESVSFSSATITGTINPRGSDTTYYFQYGPTKAYGLQTGAADAGAGTHPVKVAMTIGGLQPITPYHYRLVAVNGAGAKEGADRSLLTTKIPLSLGILVGPNPVLFGGPVVIEGTLSGTGNANRQVVLQSNPFPFTAGFVDTGNPEITRETGGFVFTLASLTASTQFRVVTTTNPAVISPVVTANVTVRVSAHIKSAGRRHHARIVGTVTPALNGTHVEIVRLVHGHNQVVAHTVLRHLNSRSSRFSSRVLRVRKGFYRVLVLAGGGLVQNYSSPLLVR